MILPLLTLALMVAASDPVAASPSPSATSSPSPWDECTKSRALPYNRPLALKMRALDAPDFDLANYRGKAVLLNIFATWCGPCNREMPALVDAARTYADRGLQVVSIDSREPDDAVRDFRKKYGITTPIAMDPRGALVRAMEVQLGSQDSVSYPVTLFVDPNGYLYCQRTGDMTRAELNYRIERFLAADAASLASPSPATSASPP